MSSPYDSAYLICPCPVENCQNGKSKIQWRHSNCGGNIIIQFYSARIVCSLCDL
jgi:hypothetical protein